MRAKKFRSNVAAVIINPTENKVLMFRRLAEKDKNSGFMTGGGQLKWNILEVVQRIKDRQYDLKGKK